MKATLIVSATLLLAISFVSPSRASVINQNAYDELSDTLSAALADPSPLGLQSATQRGSTGMLLARHCRYRRPSIYIYRGYRPSYRPHHYRSSADFYYNPYRSYGYGSHYRGYRGYYGRGASISIRF